MRRQRLENLRSLRKGKVPTNSNDAIDYRYRGAPKETPFENKHIKELWGNSVLDGEDEGRKKDTSNSKLDVKQSIEWEKDSSKFVSFFDGVDAKMKKNKQASKPLLTNDRSHADDNHNEVGSNFSTLLDDILKSDSKPKHIEPIDQMDKTRSIFDLFPLKSTTINPNKYDKHSFEMYHEAMKTIVESDRFGRKDTKKPIKEDVVEPVMSWLLRDEQVLDYDYPALKNADKFGIGIDENGSDGSLSKEVNDGRQLNNDFRSEIYIPGTETSNFYSELKVQNENFRNKLNFSKEQFDLVERAFKNLASYCAKNSRSAPLTIAWEKIKEAGIIPSNDTLNVCLYVTSTVTSGVLSSALSGGLSSRGSKRQLSAVLSILGKDNDANKEVEDENILEAIDFPTELALFHDLLYKPTEKSVSLRVKRLVSLGDASGAEHLLDSFPSNDDARLRTYLPVLKLYCEQGNVPAALRLFKCMRNEPTVRLEPENYVLMISTVAENGYFKSTSKPLEGAQNIGYRYAKGADLFDELVTEMSEDVLEISAASARRLHNALVEGLEGECFADIAEPIHSLGGVVTRNEKAGDNDLVTSRVLIEKSTGNCPRTGVTLQLIKLEKAQQNQLHESLLELSKTRFEEFTGKTETRSQRNDDYAAEKLNEFALWLNNREGKPFTAIIDGANVAYYMQNFDKGCFNFHQIQFVVDALEKSHEHPLVILPYKYCTDSFMVSMGLKHFRQSLSTEEQRILENLSKKGQLYRVPSRCLDDYYWMLASVSDQTKSRSGENLDVSHDDVRGRWPGTRPMLITNDQMRDHKLGLLEPRLFRRWTSCYIVNYSFTAFVRDASIDREISFSTADFFSREIQSHKTTTGTAWHFPVSDWGLDDRFCVRIPRVSPNESASVPF